VRVPTRGSTTVPIDRTYVHCYTTMVPRGIICLRWKGSEATATPMKRKRGDRRANRGPLPVSGLRSVRATARKQGEVEPLSVWMSCTDLLEAFADTVGERVCGSTCDEGLASMVSGLLEGTGCAVLRGSLSDEPLTIVAVTGTWEGADLRDVLAEAGPSWSAALAEDPMVVFRRRGGLRLRPLRRIGRPSGSAVAFPLLCDGERLGGVLVTHELRRAYGPSFLAAGKLLAGVLSIRLASERFVERARSQGERISRLTCDVERMGVLLRRTPAQNSEEGA